MKWLNLLLLVLLSLLVMARSRRFLSHQCAWTSTTHVPAFSSSLSSFFSFEEEAEVTQSEIRKPSFHVEDQFDQKQKQKQKHDRSTAIASSQSQFERGFNEKEPGQRTAAWD